VYFSSEYLIHPTPISPIARIWSEPLSKEWIVGRVRIKYKLTDNIAYSHG
jgi:hypothetical protein